jgi:alpha-1,2-mannosyltransferase
MTVLGALSEGRWLTADRARAYARIFLIVTLVIALGWILASRNGVDKMGKPLGTDFLGFYAASSLTNAGHPERAYEVVAHSAVGQAVFPSAACCTPPFLYPPPFLLITQPFAWMPYFVALGLWLALTGLAYALAIRRIGEGSLSLVPLFAFPAVIIEIGHGQTGFLTAALLGFGLLELDRRPRWAGVLLGALAFKPHFAVLLPFALAFSGRWRAFIATGLSGIGFTLISLAVFGISTWQAFFDSLPLARAMLVDSLVEPAKLQSAYAAVRVLGGSNELGWVVQAVAATGAMIAVFYTARLRRSPGADIAAIPAAAILATPYVFDYDLTALAIPLAWLFREGSRTGFRPWEKAILALGFILPMISRSLATWGKLPLAPLIIAAVTVAVVRRSSTIGARD